MQDFQMNKRFHIVPHFLTFCLNCSRAK